MKKTILALIIISALLQWSFYKPENALSGSESGKELKWIDSFDEAKKIATKKDKPIFILFTGSDWCPPCKQLHKHLLENEQFIELANEKLILYKADFPRHREKMDAETIKKNNELKNLYKIRGFPTVVVVSPSGEELGRRVGFGYGGGIQSHLDMIEKALEKYTK